MAFLGDVEAEHRQLEEGHCSWVFMGAPIYGGFHSGVPPNSWFIMENPIKILSIVTEYMEYMNEGFRMVIDD